MALIISVNPVGYFMGNIFEIQPAEDFLGDMPGNPESMIYNKESLQVASLLLHKWFQELGVSQKQNYNNPVYT